MLWHFEAGVLVHGQEHIFLYTEGEDDRKQVPDQLKPSKKLPGGWRWAPSNMQNQNLHMLKNECFGILKLVFWFTHHTRF